MTDQSSEGVREAFSETANPVTARPPALSQVVQFRIAELDCAEEVRQLRQALEREPGVIDLEFDVFQNRMTATYDGAVSSPERIAAGIARTGMRARPWDEKPAAQDQPWWQRQLQPLLTTISAACLVTGVALHTWIDGGILAALGYVPDAIVPWQSRIAFSCAIIAGLTLVAPKAYAALRRARPDMNLLMTVAVAGAVALGQWFEAATVSFLFCVALLLEHWSMGRARKAIGALMDLSPTVARCLISSGEYQETPIENVAFGTLISVRPGEKIPLDGTIREGTSTINEAPITGESIPVSKQSGDEVFAGTINEDGAIQIEVTRLAGDTTLARIIHLVERAQAARAPSQQWVEQFAAYYTPAMMALSLAIAVLPPLLTDGTWADWIYRGLVVLVIACPCALVISTPVSIVSALTAAARQGVLIKGGRFLEACAKLDAIAFDKTGTLTKGRPEVQEVVPVNSFSREQVLAYAGALESQSTHPLARAIMRLAKQEELAVPQTTNHQILPGRGAEAEIEGEPFWIGSHRLLHERGVETPAIHEMASRLEDVGHSTVAVGERTQVIGLISIADQVRESAISVMRSLRSLGLKRIEMLTGDNKATAAAIAAMAGVDGYQAECLPEDKLQLVQLLAERHRAVAMVGDGVNDAPAMAAATIGIAMGTVGTDTAIETADVALMSDDLTRIPWLITHARRTLSIVRQNIAFALGIKVLFVGLTMIGAASLWMAIAADMGASLLVIFNGLRLLRD